jgi:hypothetical protein
MRFFKFNLCTYPFYYNFALSIFSPCTLLIAFSANFGPFTLYANFFEIHSWIRSWIGDKDRRWEGMRINGLAGDMHNSSILTYDVFDEN